MSSIGRKSTYAATQGSGFTPLNTARARNKATRLANTEPTM
jgi:hypothetical protein